MPTALKPLTQARLVLASASPRRSMLLKQLGLDPLVDPSTVEETVPPGITPLQLVERLAAEKAADVARKHPEADLVLGADTIVVRDDQILGKPRDRAEAFAMLASLEGRWHQVYTGYSLVSPTRTITGHVASDVRFRSLTEAEINAYLDSGEPMDKAGSYAIQGLGALLVSEIKGDYNNIVGLPLLAVDAAWRELGWSVL